jgi:hypothetical protein
MDDNIKIDLKETGYNCVDWTHLFHVRIPWLVVLNVAIKFRFPEKQ